MNKETAWKNYREVLAEMKALSYARGVIYYDAATVAPEKAVRGRGKVLSYLADQEYKLRTGEKMTDAVKYLRSHPEELDEAERRETEVYCKDDDYVSAIPKEEYIGYAELLNEADSVWHKAKAESDYASFAPYLEKIFEANRRFASYYKPGEKPYDVCLDMYEKGLNTEKCDAFFGLMKEKLVPLIRRIAESRQPDDGFLHKNYPAEAQRRFSDDVMALMGIDRTRCSIGETEHPFTDGTDRDNVRITTHYYEDNAASSLYSVVHEGGHALYEMGCAPEYEASALSGGVSMGIHESQSRLYENIIGRSAAFVSLIYPLMRKHFPEQLQGVSEEMLYRAVNKSEPSLIRTEADELTYVLHVIVRYEIEKGMMEGIYTAEELPAVWNAKMKEYLGVEVPDDRHGILQDSHWSGGSVGYFPSYALGSAYAAQFVHAMQKDLDPDREIRSGSLAGINAWLGERIHRHASRYAPDDLIRAVCGEDFDPMYYVTYLTEKYGKLYGIAL